MKRISRGPKLLTLSGNVAANFLRQIDRLKDTLADRSGRDAEVDEDPIIEVRSLIQSVMVLPTLPRQPVEVEVRGLLAELTAHASKGDFRGD